MLFCSFQCGVASIDVPKIVGGEEVMPNEIPWQAFLKIEKGDNTEYNCGGVLVDSDVVLTAANCVTGRVGHRFLFVLKHCSFAFF